MPTIHLSLFDELARPHRRRQPTLIRLKPSVVRYVSQSIRVAARCIFDILPALRTSTWYFQHERRSCLNGPAYLESDTSVKPYHPGSIVRYRPIITVDRQRTNDFSREKDDQLIFQCVKLNYVFKKIDLDQELEIKTFEKRN